MLNDDHDSLRPRFGPAFGTYLSSCQPQTRVSEREKLMVAATACGLLWGGVAVIVLVTLWK
jgi:hypothetical protein